MKIKKLLVPLFLAPFFCNAESISSDIESLQSQIDSLSNQLILIETKNESLEEQLNRYSLLTDEHEIDVENLKLQDDSILNSLSVIESGLDELRIKPDILVSDIEFYSTPNNQKTTLPVKDFCTVTHHRTVGNGSAGCAVEREEGRWLLSNMSNSSSDADCLAICFNLELE